MFRIANKIYTNKVASRKSQNSLSVNNLLGVDYSGSALNIEDYHAYDSNNMIKVNGMLQGRAGWKQIINKGFINLKVASSDTTSKKLHNMWKITVRGKNSSVINEIITYYNDIKTYYVAYIGKSFYLVDGIEDNDVSKINLTKIPLDSNLSVDDLIDGDAYGVVANGRLYVLCGKYVVIKFTDSSNKLIAKGSIKAYAVSNDTDTYVPTTTIGISDTNATSSIRRYSLDDINMMTNYRYNKISTFYDDSSYYKIGGNNTEEVYPTYILDGEVDLEGTVIVNISYSSKDTYNNKTIVTETWSTKQQAKTTLYLNGTKDVAYARAKIENFTDENGNKYGKLTLYKAYENPYGVQGDNITIKFKFSSSDYEVIDGCKFGVIYGANNQRNRLFLTGNELHPNVEYHTSERNISANDEDVDLQTNQDFTYFGAYDYEEYGTQSSAVKGYQLMGDGTLMVLKESSVNEATTYFKSGGYEEVSIPYLTDSKLYKDVYRTSLGNAGVGGIVNDCLFNLDNDIVFLSSKGVYGISSTMSASSLAGDYKYCYPRSRMINNRLLKCDLNNAKCIVHDHKYYIATTENGTPIVFVADGRYKYQPKDSIDNEYEYEWFVLTNVEVDNWLLLNDDLYFINSNGLFLLKLNGETYKDTYVQRTIADGGLLCQTTIGEKQVSTKFQHYLKSSYSISNSYKINKNSLIKFNNAYYIPLKSIKNEELSVFEYDNIKKKYFINNNIDTTCKKAIRNIFEKSLSDEYKDKIKFSISTIHYKSNNDGIVTVSDTLEKEIILEYDTTSYYFDFKYNYNNSYESIHESETYGNLTKTVIFVSLPIDDWYEVSVDDNNLLKGIKLFDCTFPIKSNKKFIQESFNIESTIKTENNVKYDYYTKVYNCGQSVYGKVLRSITIMNDADIYSRVNMEIITKNVRTNFTNSFISGTSMESTWENLFKVDLTSQRFAQSYTKDFMIKFNCIQFHFYNYEGENCVINNLALMYTYGYMKKGVS